MSGKLSRKRSQSSQSPAVNVVKEEKTNLSFVKAEPAESDSNNAVDESDGELHRSAPLSSQQIQGFTESEITWAEAVSPLVNRWKVKPNTQNKGTSSPGEESPPLFRPPRFMELRAHPIKRLKGISESPRRETGSPKPLEILEKLVAAFRQEKEAIVSEEEPCKDLPPETNGNEVSLNTSEDFLLSQALDDVESRLRPNSPVLSQSSSTPKSRITPRRALRLRSKISPILKRAELDTPKTLKSGNTRVGGLNVKMVKSEEFYAEQSPTVSKSLKKSDIHTENEAIQPVTRSFPIKSSGAPIPDPSICGKAMASTSKVETEHPNRQYGSSGNSTLLVPPSPRSKEAISKRETKHTEKHSVGSEKQQKSNWKRWSSMPLSKNDGFDDDDDFESLISGIKDDTELQQSFSQPTPVRPASAAADLSMEDDFDLELLQAVEQVEALHRKDSIR